MSSRRKPNLVASLPEATETPKKQAPWGKCSSAPAEWPSAMTVAAGSRRA